MSRGRDQDTGGLGRGPMQRSERSAVRPEIQALRALAVLTVLAVVAVARRRER